MYVTRPLSLYLSNPDARNLPLPEGPNGGYLVLQDDSSTPTYFFGLFKANSRIRGFPFPQNKLHTVIHTYNAVNADRGTVHQHHSDYPVYFIPVINQPLSSNTYYAIKIEGSHKGKACASSTDEDMMRCCFCNCIRDVKPRLFDPADIYQQFNVSLYNHWSYLATSVGYPPSFLRNMGWELDSKTPKNFTLGEAGGLDPGLRARLPDFNFPMYYQASNPVVVGKWYCPFMFVKDLTPKDQVDKSMFYEMTLEQQWQRIFLYGNGSSESTRGNNKVHVDIFVPTESVTVGEADAIEDHQEGRVVWYNSIDGRRTRTGLSSLIVERMKWEEERAGWVPKEGKQGQVLKVEEFGGIGKWTNYGCYMLVERFVLKRMDGTIVLTYSFNHTHQTRSKWV